MEPKKLNGLIISLLIVVLLVIGTIYLTEKNKKEMETELEKLSEVDGTELDTLLENIDKTDTSTGVDIDTIE